MTGTGISPGNSGLAFQVATPSAGFALQNATPNIISWTAPPDGNNHRVLIFGEVNVTSAETGGKIQLQFNPPGLGAQLTNLDAGAHGTGVSTFITQSVVVASGSTVNIVQATALTVGAAVAWAEIWAS